MITHARRIASALGLATVLSLGTGPDARASLEEYVRRDDGAFAWTADDTQDPPQGALHELSLTSQVWQGIAWKHQLRIFEPAKYATKDTVLLFITGGDNNTPPGPGDAAMGFALARACGARCAMLRQVPNQPLLEGKSEDALIAETFVRYLDTQDEDWPLLFPMVKSAVRAMDAVQEWAKREGQPAVTRFVVTGASKRGWTTWLTAAVDRRVVAIAPMVIDTLNMRAQKAHALEVWGKQSDQINDYTRRGLTEKYDTELGHRLWMMVDPYAYRDRLTMPKLLINGTNDRYWTLDALNIYWDDLKGPKSVVYLPNAGHGLQEHRAYALDGIGALFRHVAAGRPWPRLSWKHSDTADGRLRLEVESSPAPETAQLWVATAPTRDFREARWNPTPLRIDGPSIVGEVARPASGFVAIFGDLGYAGDGIRYHLSTQIRQAGAASAEEQAASGR
jgi:PhoPQ-activated pathogenicity-related protein